MSISLSAADVAAATSGVRAHRGRCETLTQRVAYERTRSAYSKPAYLSRMSSYAERMFSNSSSWAHTKSVFVRICVCVCSRDSTAHVIRIHVRATSSNQTRNKLREKKTQPGAFVYLNIHTYRHSSGRKPFCTHTHAGAGGFAVASGRNVLIPPSWVRTQNIAL